jgi:lactose/L-arabinose transport system substrate-binding protein
MKEESEMSRVRSFDSVILHGSLTRRELLRRAAAAGVAAPAVAGMWSPYGSTGVLAAQNTDLSADLKIWGWEGAIEALQAADAAFQEAYPNVTLEYVKRPPADTYQQLQLSASAGSGGPDVSIIEDSHLAQFVQLGVLADLTDQVAPYVEKMNEYKWHQATADDRIYAMPWDSGPCAVFYRRDIFEQAGVDPESLATWDDYYEAAKTIKTEASVPMFQESKARNSGRTFEMLLWQRGLGYIDSEGTVILDTEPKVQETLEYLGKFWQEDLALDTESWTDPWYKAFADGAVATIPGAVWMGTFFKSFIAPDSAGKWGVVRLPAWAGEESRASNDGGSALAVWAGTEQQDAAWAYVEFHLGRDDSQLTMYKETDIFPSLETTYADPFFKEPDPYFDDQPVRTLFAEIVAEIPAAGVYSANYQEMNSLLIPEIQKYATGEQDVQQTLKAAADAIRGRVQS